MAGQLQAHTKPVLSPLLYGRTVQQQPKKLSLLSNLVSNKAAKHIRFFFAQNIYHGGASTRERYREKGWYILKFV